LLTVIAGLGLSLVPAPAGAQHTAFDSLVAGVAHAVCDKQVVLLGELPSHGEARAFEAKAKIVERLVEHCGFEALLFEAPIYDFLGFEEAARRRSAVAAQLDRAIGRFWWTRELADWRRWLFDRATTGPLRLGGLDDQVSVTSDYARASLPALVAASSARDVAAACEAAVARHLYWRYDAATPFDDQERGRLQRCVRDAADSLSARVDGGRDTRERTMLTNLASYVERQGSGTPPLNRDEAMYRNALWYIERMDSGTKVIIWTATVHASRSQGGLRQQPLGAYLATRLGERLAAIGFTAFAGWSSMAAQPRKALPEAPPNSLEATATEGGAPWVFLTASDLRRIGPAPSRLLGSFREADWSAGFDGVVVIREEVAPVFDPWK
jgi:erythromycin esterase-like protein